MESCGQGGRVAPLSQHPGSSLMSDISALIALDFDSDWGDWLPADFPPSDLGSAGAECEGGPHRGYKAIP
jgi:hypothetical protein